MIGSRLGDERSVGKSVPILHRPWRHLSKISKLIEARSNRGSGLTPSEMTQDPSLQLLLDGSTTCDQQAINCQRPIHRSSTSQLQTRKGGDCTMGTRESLLLLMHGAPAKMKHDDLECVSMDLQWPSTWSPDCQECSPIFLAPCVDQMPLYVLPSCPSRDPMPVHRAWQQTSPPQSTAHLLSPVAFRDAGQCGEWGGYGRSCCLTR